MSMLRGRFILPILCVLSGCSDPESSRLGVGSRAMVPGHYGQNGGEFAWDIEGMACPPAEDGTAVKVIADDDRKPALAAARKVRVRFLEGPLKERTGTITRWSLRPE